MPPPAVRRHGLPPDPGTDPQPVPQPGSARTIQPTIARTGGTSPHAPCDTSPATLLHNAANAIEHRYRDTPVHEDDDLNLLFLEAALGDLRIFCTWLSACYRLHATSDPAPQTLAAASRVHAAARFLNQACMILPATGTRPQQEPRERPPTDPAPPGARPAVPQRQPTATIDEDTVPLLAKALTTLASRTGALTGNTPDPLPAVRACLNAAAAQLQAARPTSP